MLRPEKSLPKAADADTGRRSIVRTSARISHEDDAGARFSYAEKWCRPSAGSSILIVILTL
ncbi:MAG: hypothetical protein IJD13_07520 [Oscillospiraceae bacterium]|nr:hypothetical protein [Oscillospiraceae bacterium]